MIDKLIIAMVGLAAATYRTTHIGGGYTTFNNRTGSGDYNEEKKHNFSPVTKGAKKNKKLLRAQRGW